MIYSEMTPGEFHAIIEKLCGKRGQRKFAELIGTTEISVSNWSRGATPISYSNAMLFRLMATTPRWKDKLSHFKLVSKA